MHYLKIGPVKIPYRIQTDGDTKIFRICGLTIPFSTITRGTRKYYRICGLTLRLPFLDKFLITQSKTNYLMRDQLDEGKIRSIAEKIFEDITEIAEYIVHIHILVIISAGACSARFKSCMAILIIQFFLFRIT